MPAAPRGAGRGAKTTAPRASRLLCAGLLAAALPAAAQAPPADAPAAPPPPLRSFPAGGLPADAAALLVSGQQGGGLPFALLALPLPGAGERARVALRVEIDGEALLAATPEGPVRAEVYVYALDERGRIGGSLLEVVEVDPERLGDELAAGGVALAGEALLLPGAYSLRVLVRAPGTDVLGLRAVPLAVPDFRARGAALLPLLFAAPAGGWLEVAASGRAQPVVWPGGQKPAARAVVAAGGTAAAEVPVWRAGEAAEVTLEAHPEGSGQGEGAAVTLPAPVTGRRAAEVPGLELLTVTFETAALSPGSYSLYAVLAGARSTMATPLVVAAAAAPGTTWAQLGRGGGERSAAAAPGSGSAPSGTRRRGRRAAAGPVQAAFREALRRLAAGDAAAARAALRDLEVGALTGARPTAPDALAAVELGVAAELAESHPEGLVPVLLLYQELYREHMAAERFVPAAHAAEMAVTLAALYAQRGGAAARPLAARLLVALALADLDRPLSGFALRALREALELHPDDEAALLALAVESERRAAYRDAVERLARLRRLRPGDREVRLRLAVNLGRLGNGKEADRLLEELTREAPRAAAGGEPDWPIAVAFHELARRRLDDAPAEAERTARAGLARFPRDEKLALLLALALDLQGRSAEARQELAALAPAGEDAASPRHLYARLPAGALARARRELERSAAERLPSLAAALAGRGAPARPGGAR